MKNPAISGYDGKSLEEVLTINLIVEYDDVWPTGWIKIKELIDLTYIGLKVDLDNK